MPKKSDVIELSRLAEGQFGLSEDKAAALVEAATVCLHRNKHVSGVKLRLTGSFVGSHPLGFTTPSKKARQGNADLQEAAEDGATAVAIAAMTKVTDYRAVERAVKGTGFDWWLGRQDGLFEARLEVSGILNGPKNVNSRLGVKKRQMNPSDSSGLPGFAAVVEFSTPLAKIVEKS